MVDAAFSSVAAMPAAASCLRFDVYENSRSLRSIWRGAMLLTLYRHHISV